MSASDNVRQFIVSDEDDGIRLDRWFKRNLPEASFGQVSRWARTGQLRVDGKRATPGDRIIAGQTIRVPPQGEEPAAGPAKASRSGRRGQSTGLDRLGPSQCRSDLAIGGYQSLC